MSDVATSIEFYSRLLGIRTSIDLGWYAELAADDGVVMAVVRAGHETVPRAAGSPPRGLLLSFEVDDAAQVGATARAMGCAPVVELCAELGQRHVMVADPDGTIVDVIERIPMTAEDRRRLARYRREHRAALAVVRSPC